MQCVVSNWQLVMPNCAWFFFLLCLWSKEPQGVLEEYRIIAFKNVWFMSVCFADEMLHGVLEEYRKKFFAWND